MTVQSVELSESLATEVNLAHPGARRFACHPGRVMAALLSRDRLQKLAANEFRYRSRPVPVGPWQLQPELLFRAEWDGTAVLIQMVHCQLHGLPAGTSNSPLRLELEAAIRPEGSVLFAEATARLSIPSGAVAGLLPRPLLSLMGRQALLACLARLETRCQTRLRWVALAWLQRGGDRAHGAEDSR